MKNKTPASFILSWFNTAFFFAVTFVMVLRHVSQKDELPIYDSVSINPYLIFFFGGSVGFRLCFRMHNRGAKLDIATDAFFLAGVCAYTVAHFSNIFHYIDPVH